MSKQWDISTTERAYFWRVEFWNNDEPAEIDADKLIIHSNGSLELYNPAAGKVGSTEVVYAEGYWKSVAKVHIYEKEMNAGTTSQ